MQRQFFSLFVCALRRIGHAPCRLAVDIHRTTCFVHCSATSPTLFPSEVRSALLTRIRLTVSNGLEHFRTMNSEGLGMDLSYNTHCVCPRHSTA